LVNSLLLFVGVNWAMFLVMPRLGTSPFQMPDESVIYRFGNDSQQLGIQIAWTAALILWQVYRGERTWRAAIVPMGFLLATLPMTQSRTAALTTAVALGTVVWTYTNGPRRVLFALVAMFSLFGVGILLSSGVADEFAANVAAKISRSGNAEELSNFTGRDVIWQWAWQEAWKTPLTGCGYGASRFVMDVGPFSFDPDHAHNLWLNTFLTIGIPGVCLLAAMWLHLAMGLLGRGDALPNVAAMVVFVAGVSEPILLGPMPRSHVMIWFIALFWTQMTRAESRIDRLSAGEIV
jgi:O-antigen ligase